MIPRYSLYLDPNELSGYVRKDLFGHWLKWVDVMDYVAYAVAHGYTPPVVDVESNPKVRADMAEDILPEDLDDPEIDDLMPDDGVDTYELITGSNRHNPIEL